MSIKIKCCVLHWLFNYDLTFFTAFSNAMQLVQAQVSCVTEEMPHRYKSTENWILRNVPQGVINGYWGMLCVWQVFNVTRVAFFQSGLIISHFYIQSFWLKLVATCATLLLTYIVNWGKTARYICKTNEPLIGNAIVQSQAGTVARTVCITNRQAYSLWCKNIFSTQFHSTIVYYTDDSKQKLNC